MRILVLNTGSSSIKYELFDTDDERSLLEGLLERVGGVRPHLSQWSRGMGRERSVDVVASDHAEGVDLVLDELESHSLLGTDDLAAIAHRVVHGGARFGPAVCIDDGVVRQLHDVSALAPLHDPINIAAIEAARERVPDVPHVAVFDTGFHVTMPPRAYRYAVPREWFEEYGIRRYGFHGPSHAFVAAEAARFLGKPLAELRLITLHLGNGASAAAIDGGRSVDTSMGVTPLEGLVMGTRSGDVDPATIALIERMSGATSSEVEHALNHDSGLLGLCGSSDMRDVHRRISEGDADAALALDVYCYRITAYVGAYAAVLGGVDAVVFTAGVGEHDAEVRARVCEGLGFLGIEIDEARNAEETAGPRAVGSEGAPVAVLVVPTDEELQIAREAIACVAACVAEEGAR